MGETRILIGFLGCVFHGTGNSARLCQNFGIILGGFEPPKPPPWVRQCLGEKFRLISKAVILMQSPRTLFCVSGAAQTVTGQLQAAVATASDSRVSPRWSDLCIWAFYRLSGPNCDNSIGSCGRQVALMMIAFRSYVVLCVLRSCDMWHHIHSCTDLTYLEWSVVTQTCASELR
jgi:hypothetical protein